MAENTRPRVRLQDADFKRGRGRPTGSINRLARESRERAEETGALPHELLLQWARGEPMTRKVPGDDSNADDPSTWITQYIPTEPDDMRDCAKSAAPYFAPKILAIEMTAGLSDAELNQLIAEFATQAGIGVIAAGEGEEDA